MYVIVLKSKYTNEIFGVLQTVSNQPRRFPDYAMAERVAHETNLLPNRYNDGIEWVVKEDDGVYFDAEEYYFDE